MQSIKTHLAANRSQHGHASSRHCQIFRNSSGRLPSMIVETTAEQAKPGRNLIAPWQPSTRITARSVCGMVAGGYRQRCAANDVQCNRLVVCQADYPPTHSVAGCKALGKASTIVTISQFRFALKPLIAAFPNGKLGPVPCWYAPGRSCDKQPNSATNLLSHQHPRVSR